jgi:hypothetical protein
MKKIVSILILLTVFGILANSQDYKNGIGIRGGFYSGIAFKHFLGNKPAFEGIMATRCGGFDITGYPGFWADGGALSVRYVF